MRGRDRELLQKKGDFLPRYATKCVFPRLYDDGTEGYFANPCRENSMQR